MPPFAHCVLNRPYLDVGFCSESSERCFSLVPPRCEPCSQRLALCLSPLVVPPLSSLLAVPLLASHPPRQLSPATPTPAQTMPLLPSLSLRPPRPPPPRSPLHLLRVRSCVTLALPRTARCRPRTVTISRGPFASTTLVSSALSASTKYVNRNIQHLYTFIQRKFDSMICTLLLSIFSFVLRQFMFILQP